MNSIGSWTFTIKDPVTVHEYKMKIHGLAMVDTCTQYADATVLPNSMVKHAVEKFDQVWLCSKPCLRILVHINGTKSKTDNGEESH